MRINKLLSNYGYCSRKETNRLIEDNRIIVNGKICTLGQWVEETDDILLDHQPVQMSEKIYLAFNKPTGITCTLERTVPDNIIDFIDFDKYIFPVGRLDKASEGLILLTNDGDLANKILESDNDHEKEYIVTVDKPFDDSFLVGMSEGVEICGVQTRQCKITKVSDMTFNITLTQGLNKQIRRMTKSFGYTVVKLQRIRILNISLDGIKSGTWRSLTSKELLYLHSL